MPSRLAILSGCLFMVLALCVAAQGAELGVIEGDVVNGSGGDAPVADVAVTLLIWQEGELQEEQTALTDAAGFFRFTDLETAGYVYRPIAEFEGITYGFEPRSFPPDETLISVSLTVHETTTAEGTLIVDRAHVIITRDVDRLVVQEVHVFVNDSSRTYLGPSEDETQGTIRFVLPPDAANIEWQGGFPSGSIALSPEGFNFDRPILPGAAQFTFSYTLPLAEDSYSIQKLFPYATRHVDVFAGSGAVTLNAPQLTDAGPVAMMEGSFTHFSGEDLAPGTTLDLTVERVESPHEHPVSTTGGSKAPVGIIITVVVVLILAVLIYPFLRRRGRRAE
ncbi:MAG: carboxypeptidase-like regulatory domain-containing protein [Candidatus Bipolaricaulia bacterium]